MVQYRVAEDQIERCRLVRDVLRVAAVQQDTHVDSPLPCVQRGLAEHRIRNIDCVNDEGRIAQSQLDRNLSGAGADIQDEPRIHSETQGTIDEFFIQRFQVPERNPGSIRLHVFLAGHRLRFRHPA